MRGRVLWGAAAWIVATALPAAAGPPPDLPPTVSFARATARATFGPSEPCSDALGSGGALVPFVVDDPDGTPEGSPPLALVHTEGGDAVVDVDYAPLPATFDPSQPLTVWALGGPDPAGGTATLTITLQPGAGYLVGEPSTLTVSIVQLDRRCDAPTFADVPTNVAQTIAVGDVPVPLQLVDPVNGEAFAALIDGTLPPGVGLTRDGGFTGAARTPGTFVATVGSCRAAFAAPPGFCTRSTLTITVLGDALPERAAPCSVASVGAEPTAFEPLDIDGSGRFLAFVALADDGRRGVFLYDTAARRLELLPDPTGRHDPVLGSSTVAISADGRTVAYALGIGALPSFSTALVVHDTVAGRTRLLAEVPLGISDLLLTADGSNLFATGPADPGSGSTASEARVYDVQTGAVHHLATGPSGLLDLAPGDTTLLASQLGLPGLVAIDTTTGAVGGVPTSGNVAVLGFAPTGAGLLVARFDDPPVRIERRDLESGATTVLHELQDATVIRSSPSGAAIGLTSADDPLGTNGDGSGDAFVLRAGGPALQVTDTSGTGAVRVAAVSDAGTVVALTAAGSLDVAGRGSVPSSGETHLYVARCGGTALARTG